MYQRKVSGTTGPIDLCFTMCGITATYPVIEVSCSLWDYMNPRTRVAVIGAEV
jgi:hypothetical protein